MTYGWRRMILRKRAQMQRILIALAVGLVLLGAWAWRAAAQSAEPVPLWYPLAAGVVEATPGCTLTLVGFDGTITLVVIGVPDSGICARLAPDLNGRGRLVWEPLP